MTRHIVMSLVVALLLAFHATAPAAANPRFAAVVVDAKSGQVVFARNADEKRYPASLTKIMTLYLVFEDLKAGRIKLDTQMKVSAHAAGEPPSKIGFKVGQTVRVEDAIRILITKSANDVAAVVGEALAGSVPAFAERMTRKARALGMSRTTFKNASGLPHSGQITTARDMATLGLAIQRDFPEMYRNFSLRSYTYRGQAYRNHNGLLGKVSGMDGIKTGFIRASGFNLTASVERNHQRIVAVVMGGRTAATRNKYMADLIEDTFRTASLTRTGGIAAFAGEPPGVDAAKLKVAKLKVASLPPPRPRSKPFGAPEMPLQVAEAPVETVGAEGSDEIGEAAAATISVDAAAKASLTATIASIGEDILALETAASNKSDAAAKASLTATIASIGEDIRAVEVAASNKSDAIFAAAQPAPAQETVLVKSGWTIQVGAFPSAEGAQTRLEQARQSGIDILSNKPGFMMAAQGSSGTIYRARFSGFTERHAREACSELSKKNVDCLALAP